jgi:glycerol-3-phosphate acyltransferase PlsY
VAGEIPDVGPELKEFILAIRTGLLEPMLDVFKTTRHTLSTSCKAAIDLVKVIAAANSVGLPCISSLKSTGYTWSYLACRTGHMFPIWQLYKGFAFH